MSKEKKGSHRKKGTGLMVCGLLLVAAALLLTGHNILEERNAERASEEALAALDMPRGEAWSEDKLWEARAEGKRADIPYYVLDPSAEMPVKEVDGHEYIGTLTIPAAGLELPVMAKWSYDNLKLSPCRYFGSVYTGNMIIAGHNYRRHFSPIKTLPVGERVEFTDMDGNLFLYRIDRIEELEKTAIEEMEAGDWELTLFTCTYGGQTRLALRCKEEAPESLYAYGK